MKCFSFLQLSAVKSEIKQGLKVKRQEIFIILSQNISKRFRTCLKVENHASGQNKTHEDNCDQHFHLFKNYFLDKTIDLKGILVFFNLMFMFFCHTDSWGQEVMN